MDEPRVKRDTDYFNVEVSDAALRCTQRPQLTRVRQQAVDINLAWSIRVLGSAYVHLSVCNDWCSELDTKSCGVGAVLRAVIQLVREIERVVGMQYGS